MKNQTTAAINRLPQVVTTWLSQIQCFYSASVQVDSVALRNRYLRQEAKQFVGGK